MQHDSEDALHCDCLQIALLRISLKMNEYLVHKLLRVRSLQRLGVACEDMSR